mmetsp:Transcript_5090/g.11926  ORF Transcript_5090/g.11926 Transcript_5090/m.11926 type:complete len:641 (-) Transcript_5090:119-2041(-)|eukprot:CAMPEP_0172639134 /NCGR_PEP_ID=MMETSP1068-20121228/217114_1 /TAXON_ID=35684 /ORGANISM="Pseudopedinella elastica, Strain CCMP716" /LENGTH=640 /DNA_ID=CAMNT_0013452191 /DNA_START=123 /DNA_END=2045 /DNA_ORIENTATION=-
MEAKLAVTGSLETLMAASLSKELEFEAMEEEEKSFPTVFEVVSEARRTVRSFPEVPSQTEAEREKLRRIRDLPRRVKAAEADIELIVQHQRREAEQRLEEYQRFSSAATDYEEAEAELAELAEQGVDVYLRATAERNIELSSARREEQVRKEHEQAYAGTHFTSWYSILELLVPAVEEAQRMNTGPRWRQRVASDLTQLEQVATGPMGLPKNPVESGGPLGGVAPGSDLALAVRRALREMNSKTPAEACAMLRGLEGLLLDYEAWRDGAFGKIRAARLAAEKRHQEARKKWRVKEGAHALDRPLDLSAGGGVTPASLAHKAVDSRKRQAQERLRGARAALPPPATEPPPLRDEQGDVALERMLSELAEQPITRDSEAAIATDYFRVLTYAAGRGHWRGALRVYKTMGDRRLPAAYPTTYQQLFLAAKLAKPLPAVALVLPLLEEVEMCGFACGREIYHSAMDVCRAAGHWRRALTLLSRMTASGLDPTTHTYGIISQAGASARHADPAEVYAAMTLAGVPAYLSYTAAAARATSRYSVDRGPVADWLGTTVLPPTNAGAVRDRASRLAAGLPSTQSSATGQRPKKAASSSTGVISRGSRHRPQQHQAQQQKLPAAQRQLQQPEKHFPRVLRQKPKPLPPA